jgi:putative PIN family toxin of toxin-antitoxin system
MIRVLLDTNVLVSTAIKPTGKPAQIFRQAAIGYELICTAYILEELADVLARPHIQKKFKELVAPARRAQFIALVESLAEMVEPQSRLEVVADADDNQILAGAVDGRADYLVTGDPHLLTVGQMGECKLVSPEQFLIVLSTG